MSGALWETPEASSGHQSESLPMECCLVFVSSSLSFLRRYMYTLPLSLILCLSYIFFDLSILVCTRQRVLNGMLHHVHVLILVLVMVIVLVLVLVPVTHILFSVPLLPPIRQCLTIIVAHIRSAWSCPHICPCHLSIIPLSSSLSNAQCPCQRPSPHPKHLSPHSLNPCTHTPKKRREEEAQRKIS